MGVEKIDRICYLCGLPGADSRDHAVAQAFFKSPLPSNLVTLPAHYECQAQYSESEDYVRNILAGMADDGSVNSSAPGDAVTRAFRRNKPLREHVAKGILLREELEEDLPPDVTGAIQFDRSRFSPGLKKTVRALCFHHTGRILSADTVFRWGILDHPSKVDTELQKMLAACKPGLCYPNTFESSYLIGTAFSMWVLLFYGSKPIVCIFHNDFRDLSHGVPNGGS